MGNIAGLDSTTFEVDAETRISDFKSMIQESESLCATLDQRFMVLSLACGGVVLKEDMDSMCLNDCGIEEGTHVTLVKQMLEQVVTAGVDNDNSTGVAMVWNSRSGVHLHILLDNGAPVTTAAFSSDGFRVLTASLDGTVRIWNALTGECTQTLGYEGAATMTTATFSADGSLVLTASDNAALLWDADTGELVQVMIHLENRIAKVCAAFAPDEHSVVTISFESKIAKIWNVRNASDRSPQSAVQKRTAIRILSGHSDFLTCAQFSDTGSLVVTGSECGAAKIWDTCSGECKQTLVHSDDYVVSASFSPGESTVLTAAADGVAKVWNASTGEPLIQLIGHTLRITSAMFSTDGLSVLTASEDKSAKIWNAQTGQCFQTLSEHARDVDSAVFSADGSSVVTASLDATAKIWNASSGVCVQTLVCPGPVWHATFN